MNRDEILIYRNPEGSIKIDGHIVNEEVWSQLAKMILPLLTKYNTPQP